MGDFAIRAQGLSKKYRIGQRVKYRTFRDTLAGLFTAPFTRTFNLLRGNTSSAANLSETFWALKDVSFDVNKGEVIGIIGRNGAGKSTLLKILSRIAEPTEGQAQIYGRVGALLEVGTGFHSELTGRENIYLNAAILGMKRAEIDRKFDQIVAFAEVEKFIDTPVKFYSSGMGLRLGFAVAAHLEPEILIVDEVLAVGDVAFQKKCLGKMNDVAGQGRTVLFVSHNMVAVQGLCQRIIWLDEGKIVAQGSTNQIISDYLQTSTTVAGERVWPDLATAPGTEHIRARRVCVHPVDNSSSDRITVSTPLLLEFDYEAITPGMALNLSLHVYDSRGTLAFNTGSIYEPEWHGKQFPAGYFRSCCYIPGDLLNADTYRVELLFVRDQGHILFRMGDALVFEVRESEARFGVSAWHGKWPGVVRPNLKWTTELLDPEAVMP